MRVGEGERGWERVGEGARERAAGEHQKGVATQVVVAVVQTVGGLRRLSHPLCQLQTGQLDKLDVPGRVVQGDTILDTHYGSHTGNTGNTGIASKRHNIFPMSNRQSTGKQVTY